MESRLHFPFLRISSLYFSPTMPEDYENVEWNVHATSNTFTPRTDTPDPLSTYDTPYEPYRTDALGSTTPSTLTSPLPTALSNNYDNHATETPIPHTIRTAKPMIIRIGDAQKHSDGTQGAHVSYMITTTVR
jgi:sorting nexin-4